ncbi:MAG: hypothetical protein HDT26_09355 [Subdoligranulum sp.]|nr:hypothetical protein [Subdoligranulum sp.]
MPYHYEATSDFQNSISEADTLLDLAASDDNNRVLFLKLAIISAVTKFQIFVERILEEFRYELNDKPSRNLSTYIKLNSLRLSLEEGNSLIGLTKHSHFTEEKKNNIVRYIQSISYISDDNYLINNDFHFATKFPLGRTGKKELVNLLKQIDGEENPFANFGNERFDHLDSVLQTRHNIVHQDRFNGTETTVKESVEFLKELVMYIDEYLSSKMHAINIGM